MMNYQEHNQSVKKRGLIVLLVIALLIGIAAVSMDRAWNYIESYVTGEHSLRRGGDHAVQIQGTDPVQETDLYKPVLAYEDAVIDAVKRAAPSVVSIVITKDLQVIEQCPSDPLYNLPPELREFFGLNNGAPSDQCETETVRREIGGGSGFIVSSDGLIVTNKHVVLDADADYTVVLDTGEKHDAEVIARDPVQDIALLQIDASGLPVAQMGNSNEVQLGQTAIAIGNSLNEFKNSVSVGVISGLSRTIDASGQRIYGVMQTDTAINPGNSGGPLLNLKGEVIGINTAIALEAENIGFAIPINDAKRDIQSVEETGEIKVAFLGVRYTMITEDMAAEEGLPVTEGALLRGNEGLSAIVEDSPAERSGLRANDIIVSVDGKRVTDDMPLSFLISEKRVGETISLELYRNGSLQTRTVTLEERP
jgi:S1-C subfamily serine protease